MQKIEHFTPPTSPVQMPTIMSSAKYVMSPDLLGLTGTNCPEDNFDRNLSIFKGTCSCITGKSNYVKSWTSNSNYGDMYQCQ